MIPNIILLGLELFISRNGGCLFFPAVLSSTRSKPLFSFAFLCRVLLETVSLHFISGMCNKAEIVTRPVHTTKFTAGKEFSLRCRCRSSSIGTVRWIKNGDTVIPVEGRISMDQRMLSINGTSFADSGNYTCYVTIDKLGTAKSEKLEVWGRCSLLR